MPPETLRHDRHLVLDMTDLGFIGAYGLTVIVRHLLHATTIGGDLALAAVPERTRHNWQALNMAPDPPIYATVDDACAAFDRKHHRPTQTAPDPRDPR